MSKPGRLDSRNTAFYSTASSGYAIYSAVSLLTIRDYLPKAKLCILSSGLSDYDKKVLERSGIEYHELDLEDKFTKTWDYPIECYYSFAGPEIFYRQGFEYSVYIDGDILCAANPIAGIAEVTSIASAEQNGEYILIFGDDWDKIRKTWKIPNKAADRKRINSGVVYFNNQEMARIELLNKAGQLFQQSLDKDIPRKGDDSLLALFQYVHMNRRDIQYLPPKYNYVLQFNEWHYPVQDLVFFHFSLDKPWKARPYKHGDTELDIFNPYVRLWRYKFRKVVPRAWAINALRSSFKAAMFKRPK